MDLNRTAATATLHCLTGCAIGEVLGMIISTAANWTALSSIVLSFFLAFVFGYGLSMRSLMQAGLGFNKSLKIALAADSMSILVMELSDNGFILVVPGALYAGLNTLLFWTSLGISLIVAFVVAFPVNRFLISHGRGHAIAHKYHSSHKHK